MPKFCPPARRKLKKSDSDDSDDGSSSSAAPFELSDAQKKKNARAAQMADLGSATRDFLTSFDPKAGGPVNHLRIQANRDCNKQGTEAARLVEVNRDTISAWTNFHQTSEAKEAGTEHLMDLGGGQSHREALSESLRPLSKQPFNPNFRPSDRKLFHKPGKTAIKPNGGKKAKKPNNPFVTELPAELQIAHEKTQSRYNLKSNPWPSASSKKLKAKSKPEQMPLTDTTKNDQSETRNTNHSARIVTERASGFPQSLADPHAFMAAVTASAHQKPLLGDIPESTVPVSNSDNTNIFSVQSDTARQKNQSKQDLSGNDLAASQKLKERQQIETETVHNSANEFHPTSDVSIELPAHPKVYLRGSERVVLESDYEKLLSYVKHLQLRSNMEETIYSDKKYTMKHVPASEQPQFISTVHSAGSTNCAMVDGTLNSNTTVASDGSQPELLVSTVEPGSLIDLIGDHNTRRVSGHNWVLQSKWANGDILRPSTSNIQVGQNSKSSLTTKDDQLESLRRAFEGDTLFLERRTNPPKSTREATPNMNESRELSNIGCRTEQAGKVADDANSVSSSVQGVVGFDEEQYMNIKAEVNVPQTRLLDSNLSTIITNSSTPVIMDETRTCENENRKDTAFNVTTNIQRKFRIDSKWATKESEDLCFATRKPLEGILGDRNVRDNHGIQNKALVSRNINTVDALSTANISFRSTTQTDQAREGSRENQKGNHTFSNAITPVVMGAHGSDIASRFSGAAFYPSSHQYHDHRRADSTESEL